MAALILLLLVAAIPVAALLGRRGIASGLAVGAVTGVATAAWAAFRLSSDAPSMTADIEWVPGLDLGLHFRLDDVALVMTVLISGIGAAVFTYAIGYFSPGSRDARFPATLLGFGTSMLGLAWADSVWTLFIFWELTSVTSFLLVGHKHQDASVRLAARRALLITGGGGLALLAGLIVLSQQLGTSSLTDLGTVSGPAATAAALLVLAGAATKSAQVPFHVWLPGAMKAPTPVSAYLHSATMVKAGVLLVAVVGPAFAGNEVWQWAGIVIGLTSMIWGAIGALRQFDAKLILAWGTVSQLGLLIVLFTAGSPKATFAGVAMLIAHAIFKATLFLGVGEIDVRTGTRDIRELGGLARSMPIATVVSVLSALSMAGAPPLLGFMTKEAAIEAGLGLDGPERLVVLGGVIAGSVLTVAYTTRYVYAVFGPGPVTAVSERRLAMTLPAVVLATLSVAGYLFPGAVTDIVAGAAGEINAKSTSYALYAWPGFTTAFSISLGVLAVGSLLGFALARRIGASAPRPLGADTADAIIDGTLEMAKRVTARVQHGSLPVYLATMGGAVVLAALPFLSGLETDHLTWWQHPAEPLAVAIILAASVVGAIVGDRLGAALTLGAVGLGVTGLFIVRSSPDLALTQLLVETVVVVGFVFGLGRLRRRFPEVGDTWRAIRITIAAAVGVGVTMALAAAGSRPAGEAPIGRLADAAVDQGGGKNIVNVILTDIRALDTLGEVVVLATVALGIYALARIRTTEVTS